MHSKPLLKAIVIAVLSTAFFCPIQAHAVDEKQTGTTTSSTNNGNPPISLEDVQRFSNALNEIKKYYVKPVNDDVLFANAIRGMLTGLDPHSDYLDEDSFSDLQTTTSGEFGGLGLEVTMEEGVVKVVSPLVDTPAYKAGVKSGDYIIKLGSQSVQGLSLKEAVELMRGKPGSALNITILRKGEPKPLQFSLIREKILIKSVKSQLLDGNYGYVRLTQFQSMTADDMQKAIAQLQQQAKGHLKGLILDLRDNPGGLLDSAIQVADSFLGKDKNGKEEMIVYTQGRLKGSKFTAYANAGDILNKAPMIVLINNGSASASEIVAGALKDNKRAIIVGTRSFGKGSVQTVIPLDDKHAIKLTTALYYTPSGVSIQAKGITPDIVVDELSMKNVEAKQDFLGYTEADLNGHIANQSETPATNEPGDNNGNIKLDKVPSENKKTTDQELLSNDYQLYTALTIMRGLAFANH